MGNPRTPELRPQDMRIFLVALATAWLLLLTSTARAQDTRQASQHFQRGVALYGEADYRAALVEFKRAYTLAPNPAVLYNIGETEYQLQDYAGALTSFERFLAEASVGDARRAEVDGNLAILRARVGHLSVTTAPAGADVSIDDQPAGKTPLERPLLVSIGRRTIVATMPGRAAVTRTVDVAAEDNLAVSIELPEPAEAPARIETTFHPSTRPPSGPPGATLRIVGWTATAALAAGAGVMGALALRESHDLESERGSFPASAQSLGHDASLTQTYSLIADSLTGAALLVGGVTLFSTLTAGSPRPANATHGKTELRLGPAAASLLVTF
jgi:hypothetical protein